MSTKIGINGFGRTGRQLLRAIQQDYRGKLEVVGINNRRVAAEDYAHLFKHDTTYGAYQGEVESTSDSIIVDGSTIRMLSASDIADLPWGDLGVDIVIESTGHFSDRDGAAKHLTAGAKKVIISAPGKNEDITIVLGVNHDQYDSETHDVISNASCTTNCLAPVVKVLVESFGFRHGLMTTIHAYTNDQSILDLPHSDLRRARAAGISMIPTTTGAAKATGLVLPAVAGRIDGMALRVPTSDVSIVDVVVEVEQDTTAEEVNAAFRDAASGALQGILDVSDEPLVSIDYRGNPFSSIVDSLSTSVMSGRMVKVLSWYDNEWGYSNRVVDLVRYVGERLPATADV